MFEIEDNNNNTKMLSGAGDDEHTRAAKDLKLDGTRRSSEISKALATGTRISGSKQAWNVVRRIVHYDAPSENTTGFLALLRDIIDELVT